MAIVKDILSACDFGEVMRVLTAKYSSADDPMLKRDRAAYTKAFTASRDIEPQTDPCYILFAVPQCSDGIERISASLVKKADIANCATGTMTDNDNYLHNCWTWDSDIPDGTEPSADMSQEIIDKICDCGWHITTYGYDFDEWAVILGYEVDMPSVEKYGVAPFAADILEEMTFLSPNEETRRELAEELNERTKAVDEVLASGDTSCLITWEEAAAELGIDLTDPRTPDEIEADRRQNRFEMAYAAQRSLRIYRARHGRGLMLTDAVGIPFSIFDLWLHGWVLCVVWTE